jgi:N utilization substance protein B
MKRRKAREYALQLLFQYEFMDKDSNKGPDLSGFWEQAPEQDLEVKEFAEALAVNALRALEEIDKVIEGAAKHWALERMAAVDRNIMRLAVYELLYRDDIPHAVTINEALEIAKKFSSQDSAAFINGILDKVSKARG